MSNLNCHASFLDVPKNNIQRRKREKLPDDRTFCDFIEMQPNKDLANDKTIKLETKPHLSGENQQVAVLQKTDLQFTQGI